MTTRDTSISSSLSLTLSALSVSSISRSVSKDVDDGDGIVGTSNVDVLSFVTDWLLRLDVLPSGVEGPLNAALFACWWNTVVLVSSNK